MCLATCLPAGATAVPPRCRWPCWHRQAACVGRLAQHGFCSWLLPSVTTMLRLPARPPQHPRPPPPWPPQAHSLACELLAVMAQEPLSMRPETTVELTQLVALLEAPAFAPLRLQLLQPQQFPALQRAVHGLLMLLPQVGGWMGGWAASAGVLGWQLCSALHPPVSGQPPDCDRLMHCPAPSCCPPQGDAFRMLQARLAPIPIMAMLSRREPPAQHQQHSSGALSSAGSAAALAQSPPPLGSPAGSPGGSGTWAAAEPAAAEQEACTSPRQRQQAQRPRHLMQLEEKRLVQLFKSRASRLG